MKDNEVMDFCNEHDITIDQFYGEEKISRDLNLSSLINIPQGFNPTVGGSLDLESVKSIPQGFNPIVGGGLYLESVESLPQGFNPTVGGNLNLRSVINIPQGFNPIVGGYLNLESVTTLPQGFNPTVGGVLWLSSVTTFPKGFNPTVGGSLNLSSVESFPQGFNPTVGGYLNLESVTTLPQGFNPTVGGVLWLSSVTTLPKGFNPIVGGNFYLESVTTLPKGFNPIVGEDIYLKSSYEKGIMPENEVFTHNDKKYIHADGILTEVTWNRGNVYHVKHIGWVIISYLVNDKDKWSHGDTLKEARESLIYKISNRDTSIYDDFTRDTQLTFGEGIECYRVITGACASGTRHFVESCNIKKQSYTIQEIISMTQGSYGYEMFKEFFED